MPCSLAQCVQKADKVRIPIRCGAHEPTVERLVVDLIREPLVCDDNVVVRYDLVEQQGSELSFRMQHAVVLPKVLNAAGLREHTGAREDPGYVELPHA